MKNLKIRSVLCIFLFICSAGVCDALPKKVETVRHSQGEWELKVDGEPFIIKGVVYNFSVVGDDPD
ncbi:MAG: hypothetical protein KKD07_04315, partial [Candidatus Omnitrophica bacterium]|nr:hypothetical protein [Candidatus Omnitrophota bacterium]